MKRFIFCIAACTALLFTGCSSDDERPVKTPIDPATDIYGVVVDNNGRRLQGVVVSDGYTCALTDENGVYQLTASEFAYHVNISLPEAYEVPSDKGLPYFWQKLTEGRKRYDFTLTPLAGGVENEFNLFCVADPQCQNTTNVARFSNETVPDIAAQVAASTLPCYGITLGDIGWNTANTDYTNDIFPLMKVAMQQSKVGLPLFQVMGNHDNKVISVTKANYTVEHDIAAQRNFELAFGPVNYSFNRGSVHVVAMDNIIFPNHNDYSLGFRDDQVEWLKQDLSYVSKDKMVILCTHIPMRNGTSQNVNEVIALLKSFAEVHIMTGHTHYAENNVYADHYEHVHGAACGAWWNSTINTDGTPNGYAIYKIKGATIDSWSYKATGLENDFQIRLYRADETFMRDYAKSYKFYYNGGDQIIANIWNADKDWTIEVYENGVKSGEMTRFEHTGAEKDKSWDAWALGYHIGVVGKNEMVDGKPTDYYQRNVRHLYYYTLKSASASVEIRATDRFGKTYTQTQFTTGLPEDFPAGE
ncbi:calcineurin-like phosphoesterase C-terminal domain-containing protein [uncultured Alistipes sp.]|jgi:metallophosphoesterase|uniref:calcineurin-like phosphoesterase C-terminal domain-containing protein n=1 Tax=uncultured Alistipes sp. TaxID=538949 RepID=UPI0025DB5007|nr:calcineurin-like phosphoesterase C-terminal domain-containing protein [uncultured Alistipes sp.]